MILGEEHIIRANRGENGAMAAVNRRGRDPLFGKDVEITKGEWKGYKGRVKRADDRQVIVEITSKCRQIAIDKDLVKPLESKRDYTTRGDDGNQGGMTVYEGGKTPMQYNTPSYYP